jgi:hypothetical protein
MSSHIKKFWPACIIVTSFMLVYCSSYSYLPTTADVYNAKIQWPEIDSSLLYKGYHLYKNKCGSCHFLYKPENYSLSKWDSILSKMKLEAKITDEQLDLIKKYVYTHKGKM